MYTLGYSNQNRYCKPSTMYTFGFGNKANTSTKSTAQYHHFDSSVCTSTIRPAQDNHFGTNAYNNINVTQDVRFDVSANHNVIAIAHDNQTYSRNSPLDSSASIVDCVSAESSTSRFLDDVMSIDTFPCVPVHLMTDDKIVNWLDIPLEILCIHTNNNIDDEEISMPDDFKMNAVPQCSVRMSAHLFSPVANTYRSQGQWHFDIESVESGEMSINTVETWSLSEDFS